MYYYGAKPTMPIASGRKKRRKKERKKERKIIKPMNISSQNSKRLKIRGNTFEVHKHIQYTCTHKKSTFRDLSGTQAIYPPRPRQTSNRPRLPFLSSPIPIPSFPLVPYSLRVLLRGLTPCAKNLSVCAG